MAAKPRVRVPDSVKVGDVIEVKTLIAHVMETGNRKSPDGKPIPRNIINTFRATYGGKEVFKAAMQPGISANPYISFHVRVTGPGDIEMEWVDDSGEKITHKQPLKVG